MTLHELRLDAVSIDFKGGGKLCVCEGMWVCLLCSYLSM